MNSASTTDPVTAIYAVCQLYRSSQENSSYLQSVKDLIKDLVNLNNALMYCEDDVSGTKIKEVAQNPLKYAIDKNGSKDLVSLAVTQLDAHLNDTEGKYAWTFNYVTSTARSLYDANSATVEQKETTVKTAVSNAQTKANAFYKKMDEKSKNLQSAIDYLNKALDMLNGAEGTNYATAQKNWSDAATNLGSSDTMGQRDLDELNDLKKIITVDNVTALINRLTKAKESIESVKKAIADYKICDTSWKDISADYDYKALIKIIKGYDSGSFHNRITGVGPTVDTNTYTSVVNDIQAKVVKGVVPTFGENDQNPDLSKQSTQLYAWLQNNFHTAGDTYTTTSTTKETTKADKDLDSTKKNIESSKAEGQPSVSDIKNKDKKTEESEGEGKEDTNKAPEHSMDAYTKPEDKLLPSTRWDDELKAAAVPGGSDKTSGEDMMSNENNDNFLKTLMNLASDIGESLRNKLYISEYMMSMFSFDTIETELYDEQNTNSNKDYKDFFTYSDGAWKVTEGMESYAAQLQTLTKVQIDPNMNYLYGGEVEYILYGKSGTTKVYATIFALRFALNSVYAFTDAEINNITLSAATALFGTPPLTPLIPVAKVAMTLALAIAESGWDLYELSEGKAIPLMKNKDTWVMSPSGAAGAVKDKAVEVSKGLVEDAVDAGYDLVNEALNATSEELEEMIGAGTEEAAQKLERLTTAAVDSATSSLENYANLALQRAVELCNQVNQEFMLDENYLQEKINNPNKQFVGNSSDKAKIVKERLQAWLNEQTGDQPIVAEAKQIAVNYLSEDMIATLFDTIEAQCTPSVDASGASVITDVLNAKLGEIKEAINNEIKAAVGMAGTALSDMKNQMITELQSAAKDGADKLKSVLSEKLDDCFNKIPTNDAASKGAASGVVSSLLSWRYSDYLRIFVVVGLMVNEEVMLLRTADLIERNMQYKNGQAGFVVTTEEVEKSRFFGLWKYTTTEEKTSRDTSSFSLDKSYTYMKLTATLQVKPLLMTLPFMADTVENSLTGTDWYAVEVTSIMGY